MGETAARRGTEKRQRQRHIDVRCDDAEHAAITAAAARAGMTVGTFTRHRLTDAPALRAVRRPQVDRVELARALAAMGKIGSNINQLARAANGGAIPLEHELAEAATATMAVCSALMRALGRGD